jgi:hypothetical protein
VRGAEVFLLPVGSQRMDFSSHDTYRIKPRAGLSTPPVSDAGIPYTYYREMPDRAWKNWGSRFKAASRCQDFHTSSTVLPFLKAKP